MVNISLISGRFNPIHSDDIRLINKVKKFGHVCILLTALGNSRDDRAKLLKSITGVIEVWLSDNLCKSFADIRKEFPNSNITFSITTSISPAEVETCKRLNINLVHIDNE